jgi:hypothetical protein
MPRYRTLSAAVLASLPALTLAGAGAHAASSRQAGPASPARPDAPAWRLAASQHFGQPGNASGFSSILNVEGHTWVFGGTNPGGVSAPVAETETHGGWRASSLPAGLSGFISSASASSEGDIWALSDYGRYLLHWNGRSWRLARSWRQSGVLTDVVAVSWRDVWVFGTSAGGTQSMGAWHFDGRSWVRVSGIAAGIYRASALSSRDIWAIAPGLHGDAIVRLGSDRWRRVHTTRAMARVRWHDILAESRSNVWVIGNEPTATGTGRLVLAHWDGVRWRTFSARIRAFAGQLAPGGRDRVLATATSVGLVPEGVILEVTGTGHMTRFSIVSSLGSGVADVTFAPRTGALWASGGILTRLGGDAAIWVLPLQPHDSAWPTDADGD